MIEKRWRDLFELVGLLSVVASLIFVGIQLRQDQVLARAELASGSFTVMAILNQTMSYPQCMIVQLFVCSANPCFIRLRQIPQHLLFTDCTGVVTE